MKSSPILMSAPMVRATLADLKTQTRRVVEWKYGPDGTPLIPIEQVDQFADMVLGLADNLSGDPVPFCEAKCRYGVPGDQLWVKETAYIAPPYFGEPSDGNCVDDEGRKRVVGYVASMDADSVRCATDYGVKKSPSIHMPRWASRITLRVLSVRVERLQDITEADAIAEGIRAFTKDGKLMKYAPAYRHSSGELEAARGWTWQDMPRSAVEAYALLWDSINGDGAWAANPWVWRVEFQRVKAGA